MTLGWSFAEDRRHASSSPSAVRGLLSVEDENLRFRPLNRLKNPLSDSVHNIFSWKPTTTPVP